MRSPVDREIRRFARRVRLGRFLGATSEGLAVTGLACAATLLGLRLFEVVPAPRPAWLLLLLPALAWGLAAAGRAGFGRRLSAVHLDRRLGLEGLLVTALERDTGAYADRLRERLERAREAQPHLRPRPMLLRVGVAGLVLCGVLLLPAPEAPRAHADPLRAETLEAFEARLKTLAENEGLREETREELRERLQDLSGRMEERGEVTWTDLDALEEKLEHERAMHAARLARARQDLAAFARGEDEQARGAPAAAAERLAALMKDAQAAGLLDHLPAEVRERLADAMQGEGASGLEGLDASAREQLAAAMAQAAGDALEGLDAAGLLEGLELSELGDLLEGLEGLEGEPCVLCEGKEGDEDCPG